MIYSQAIGGLGNQMFQYAIGRALSLQRERPFMLDISGYAGYRLHQGYELSKVFNCSPTVVTDTDQLTILGWQRSAIIRRLLTKNALRFFRLQSLVVEPYFDYWQGIESVPEECYLSGYWQSEKYFSKVDRTIRADFVFSQPLKSRNAKLAKAIASVNSVSLHIRRGDYVSNPAATATHGVCSLEYYRAAIKYVTSKVSQPNIFIFSDDIDWAKQNLHVNLPCHYVGHNVGADSYCDMQLMSLCGHHIIANSTFSWWGAWLNPDPQKVVIAPAKWFADGRPANDLYPAGWILL